MLIIFKDLDTGKLSQYTSGNHVRGHFTLDKAIEELNAFRARGKVVKTYDDDDYLDLKNTIPDGAEAE